jgi:L-ornithine N5-oxygenase
LPIKHGRNDAPYDIVGVGFGPSNLALAIAVREHSEIARVEHRLTARFLECKPNFGWHSGMLLDDATMQISFLKDLATLRNPSSTFTFLTYLHKRGRLNEFINYKTMFPTRVEFEDYLRWAAARFSEQVDYDTNVVDVRPVLDGDDVTCLDVIGRSNGHETVYRTRNLVIGTGIVPMLPPEAEGCDRIWHSSELLDRLNGEGAGARARRFAVIGAGQSGAEVTAYLHQHVPESEVHAIFSRYGYSPADDSAFANRVFDPDAVDEFFMAPESVKEQVLHYHANTNYSVVDLELIDELYRRFYREGLRGKRRLHVHHLSKVAEFLPGPESAVLRVRRLVDERIWDLEVDVAICATGYRPMDASVTLGTANELCERNGTGRFRVERDYRIATVERVGCGIYLQGGTEHTHGLSSSLLSTAALRAGEIVESVVRRSMTPTCQAGAATGAD